MEVSSAPWVENGMAIVRETRKPNVHCWKPVWKDSQGIEDRVYQVRV
jgi:hypothetical protein